MIEINTDGACEGNPGRGGFGAHWVNESGVQVKMYGGSEMTTNNKMELTGPIMALRTLLKKGYEGEILLRSDSQYVIKGVNEWRKGWVSKGWKNSKGEPVKNKELWVELFELVDHFGPRLKWQWVKGHNGDPGNELADELSRWGQDYPDKVMVETIDLETGKEQKPMPFKITR